MCKKVTFVLVSYNDRPYMEEFFRSAFAQDYPNWDMVVVDNASQDDSAAFAAQQKRTHVIALQENVGFGEGCNIGTRYALEHGADAVLLLNIDTTFQPNLLTELVRLSEGRFVTTALTYCNAPDGGRQLWYAGGTIDWKNGNTNQLLYTQEELAAKGPAFPVDFVSGCCMLLPRPVVEQVGLFDPAFFLYYEDTDLCVRLQQAGVELRCATTTSVWHKVGGSSLGGNEMSCSTQYYTVRNRLLFAQRYADHIPGGNLNILRTILTERAYFDGPQNKKQEPYVLAAIQDYLREHFVRGHYGRLLIEDHYCVPSGFYEREEDGTSFWYWASASHAKIYLANPRRQTVLYDVCFDTLLPKEDPAATLTVEADGHPIGRYAFPAQPRFSLAVAGESVCCLDLAYTGPRTLDNSKGNPRALYYRLADLKVRPVEQGGFLPGDGFYEQEEDGTSFWYWASASHAKIYLANPRRQTVLYDVCFDTLLPKEDPVATLTVEADGHPIGQYAFPAQPRFALAVAGESVCCLDLAYTGSCTLDESQGSPRALYYRLADLKVSPAPEDSFFVGDGFDQRESDETTFWHWANAAQGKIYLANPKPRTALYHISFDTLLPVPADSAALQVTANGSPIGQYAFPAQPRFALAVAGESVCCLEFSYTGPCTLDESQGNPRALYYRLADLKVLPAPEDSFFVGDGFDQRESDGISFWHWANAAQGRLYLANPQRASAVYNLQFEIAVPPEAAAADLQIMADGRPCGRYPFPAQPRFSVIVAGESLCPLDLFFNGPATVDTAGDHPRTLYYQLANPRAERTTDTVCFSGAFYPLEVDPSASWRWCAEPSTDIWLCPPVAGQYTLRFHILPLTPGEGTVAVYCNGAALEMQGDTLHTVLTLTADTPSLLRIETSCPPVQTDGRPLCFQVRDFTFTPAEDPDRA